jgi:PD-(D/E)XK nuclease superfamily
MSTAQARYVNELNRLVRQPSIELEKLLRQWPKALKQFKSERSALLSQIPPQDPLRLSVDLLQSIRCASDETLHTQALAYALDPERGHGFAKGVLVALLKTVSRLYPRAGAARVLRRVEKQNVTISVTPEFRFRVEGIRNRSVARSDIWIEAKVRESAALIVIENKIRAGESQGQLAWYERKVRIWCKQHGARYLLIFLSKDGKPPSSANTYPWVAISYLQLAAALRMAWRHNIRSAGAEWLALYIASITKGVLGMDLERWGGVKLADVQTYLGKGW